MSKKVNVPELRFPEFEDEWKTVRLNEILEYSSSNLSLSDLEDNEGKYALYGADGLVKSIDFYEKEEPYIAIVKDGAGVGRHYLCDSFTSVIGTMQYLTSKDDYNLNFCHYLLNRVHFTKYIVGSTIPHIYFKEYSKEKVKIPSIAEQEKIASFLSAIDEKIDLLTRSCEQWGLYKQEVMRRLFTQELRFPEFKEEWKTVQLKDIFKFHVAGDMKKELFNEKRNKEFKYPLYSNAIENNGLMGYYKEYKYEPNSITVTARGNIGHAVVRRTKFNAIGRVIVLTPNADLNLNFIAEYINNNINIHIESTGVPQLTAPSLKINKIQFPSVEEQDKIGNFLNKITEKIELTEQQLEQTRKFKKAMLQKMFI